MALLDIVDKLASTTPLTTTERDELLAYLQGLLDSQVQYNETKPLVDALYRRGVTTQLPRIYAGAVLAGDPTTTDPDMAGTNYTGTFYIYPPILLPNGDYANIGGMSEGVIQWYGNSTTGKMVAGAGAVTIDAQGIRIINSTAFIPAASINFIDGSTISGSIYGISQTSAEILNIYQRPVTGKSSNIFIVSSSLTGQDSNVTIRAESVDNGILKLSISSKAAQPRVQINDNFLDADVQIAGVSDGNLFYTDASTNRVGIGTSTPAVKLDVVGAIAASSTVTGSNLSGTNTGDSVSTPTDGWIAATGTWTPRSQAYTNDPAAGSNISLSMTDTSGFAVGDLMNVSSSAGNEDALITVVTANTSITVDVLTLNHTTTTPLVKFSNALYLQRAYTNDPAAGSNIALNMANTTGFSVGNKVVVSSSAGWELAVVTVVTASTSITVNTLALNHTTTNPMVTIQTQNTYIVDTSVDLSGSIQVGDRVKFTDTTVKEFIVHAIATTRLTLFGGTDYAVAGTAAVTSPSYSHISHPYGFNPDPDKWSVSFLVGTANFTKASPAANTWYGGTQLSPTGPSISAPIGIWYAPFKGAAEIISTLVAVAGIGVRWTLSDGESTESDPATSNQGLTASPIGTDANRFPAMGPYRKISISSRKTLYVNIFTGQSSVTSISLRGDLTAATITLVSAYL